MALGIPHLDQITATPLDSLNFILDSSVELNRLEFSNPYLEQLDSWGVLDNLNSRLLQLILLTLKFRFLVMLQRVLQV